MSDFALNYHPLSQDRPEWGDIAALPWDEQIFGFPVADYRPGVQPPSGSLIAEFAEALRRHTSETGIRVISVHVPTERTQIAAELSRAGFYFVDLSLVAQLNRLKVDADSKPRISVRLCAREDQDEVCRIAGKAFRFGRYHTDPRFPRELADRRYVQWMRNALEKKVKNNRVFVAGPPGKPFGFADVVLDDSTGVADLRLLAVDPDHASGLSGYLMVAELLRQLAGGGARSVKAKVSAANTEIMNVYASRGFHFSYPETVLHWHA